MSDDDDLPGPLLDFARQVTPNTGDAPPGDDEKCPKCGADTLYGYGLAGGGFGVYWCCENDACDYFFKRQDKEG